MKTPLACALPLLLAACPGPEPERNPPRLYLRLLNNMETMVQLLPEIAPAPF